MNPRLDEIWVYLTTSPLLGLTATLLAYQAAWWLHCRFGKHPLVNPVLIAVALLVTALMATGIPYARYFEGAQFVHFLLGPATVALAIPLYAQWPRVKTMLLPILFGLSFGSLVAILSAVAIGKWLGASGATLFSLAPKSVTTPIAMGIAERIGGLPSLTAVLVITTGVLGAMLGRLVFDRLRIRDPAMRGFAMGVTAHGIGTARAFQVSEQAGAFSALAMGMNGLLTALLLPLLLPWLQRWFAP